MNVMDASALLAFLKNEPGAGAVENGLLGGACCSSVNWSETAQKIRAGGGDWVLSASALKAYSISIEPATVEDAERAAVRWNRLDGLSLGGRFCLALGDRLDATVWTADRAWAGIDRVRLIR